MQVLGGYIVVFIPIQKFDAIITKYDSPDVACVGGIMCLLLYVRH